MPKHISSPQSTLFQQDKGTKYRHFVQGTTFSELSEKAIERYAFKLQVTPQRLRRDIALIKKGGFGHE